MGRQEFLDFMKEVYKENYPKDNFSARTYNAMIDRANKEYDKSVEVRCHRGDRRR